MASKRHIRRRGCESKIRHEQANHAEGAARSMHERFPHQQFTWYGCHHCGGFHVTHDWQESMNSKVRGKGR